MILYSFLETNSKKWYFSKEYIIHTRNLYLKLSFLDLVKGSLGCRNTASAVGTSKAIAVNPKIGDVTFVGNDGYVVVMRDNVVWTSFFSNYSSSDKLRVVLKETRNKFEKKGNIYG